MELACRVSSPGNCMSDAAPHSPSAFAMPSPTAPTPSGERDIYRPSGWRARLPIAALVFVIASLLALAVTPLQMSRRLRAVRSISDATTNAASPLLPRLRVLIAEQVIVHQLIRTGADSGPLIRYRQYRAEEEQLIGELLPLARRIGPAAARWAEEVRARAGRLHDVPDARADGRLTEAQFAPMVTPLRFLRDSLLVAEDSLAAEIGRVEQRNRARGARLVSGQEVVSSALGVLALLAAAVVAWYGRRERQLTRALAGAVAEEARLRAVAEQRREDLVRVSESKARLMRGFSHDVKNPLGAADGFMALLEEGIMGPLAEKQQRSVERARRAIRAALNLIGDLLELAKAETGNIDIRLAPTDVREVAREAAEEFRAQAEAKGLTMVVDLRGEAVQLQTDPVRVRQVLGNLISNAVKYTPRGSVTVRMAGGRPAPTSKDGRRCVGVEVSDTGAGIAPEKMRLLFQEFVRLDPRAGPGVGIGLAISHRIVQALGGDLTVESEPGRGSTFVLWLPAGDAPSVTPPAAPAGRDRRTGERPRIL